jgi:hypothetical protein
MQGIIVYLDVQCKIECHCILASLTLGYILPIIYNFLLQLHRRLSEHDIFFTKSENQVSTIEIQYHAI